MGKHNIEKKTPAYSLLFKLGIWIHNLLYREFVVINKPDLRSLHPDIYTPNHQNALMDALALLFAKNKPLVFLARSDIFKKKTIASIMYFIKILPVFRIRDGFDSLKNNQETFDHTVRVLSSNRGLVILPEGNHEGIKRLRPLKKGFARIAFMTEINGNEKVNLNIVPVGIDYTSYTSFFTRLTVVFGEPFALKDFMPGYKEKPEIELNRIKEHLAGKLRELIIHVEHDEFYSEVVAGTAIYAEYKHHNNPEQRYFTQRDAVQKLNELYNSDLSAFNKFGQNVSVLKKETKSIPDEIIGLKPKLLWVFHLINSLLITPLAIPGLVTFGLFYIWPKGFTRKKIKDPQFRTSVRYVLYVIQFLLINMIGAIILFSVFPWKSALVILVSIVLSGILSYKIVQVFLWNWYKTKWLIKFRGRKGTEIVKCWESIVSTIDEMMEKEK
jgi:1-acyl-sn-glycerol-3-phosphate acyltransferase